MKQYIKGKKMERINTENTVLKNGKRFFMARGSIGFDNNLADISVSAKLSIKLLISFELNFLKIQFFPFTDERFIY